MDEIQRQKIRKLRSQGYGYLRISAYTKSPALKTLGYLISLISIPIFFRSTVFK